MRSLTIYHFPREHGAKWDPRMILIGFLGVLYDDRLDAAFLAIEAHGVEPIVEVLATTKTRMALSEPPPKPMK